MLIDPVPYRDWNGVCDLCCADSGDADLCHSCRKNTRALGLDLDDVSLYPLGLAVVRPPDFWSRTCENPSMSERTGVSDGCIETVVA